MSPALTATATTTVPGRSLYLTRLHLDPHHPAARRDLADRDQLHKTLMCLAGHPAGPTPRRSAGLLFRLETDTPTPTVLVQSSVPPQPHRLPSGYASVQTHDTTGLLTHLAPGQPVHYRITASPVRNRPGTPIGVRDDGRLLRARGRPTPLHGDEALAWWQRQADQAGLALHTAALTSQPFITRQRAVRHHLIQFDGHAHIHDTTALTHALHHGIGRAKSYGAGLLSLAPAHGR
ncbi:type I-E CRISPR-associated protein Cas6/Cse3/CasE [Streptomyces sp. NPDC102364]|uniref:type I-E CRISPR-associated protein Cas6/Cse3/CasE n=1 Tax=Streptomyces sp. NPDC102364 TaxID=3366161 RepID=UPI00382D591E